MLAAPQRMVGDERLNPFPCDTPRVLGTPREGLLSGQVPSLHLALCRLWAVWLDLTRIERAP